MIPGTLHGIARGQADTILLKMRTLLLLILCGVLSAQTSRLTLEDLLSAEPIGETALSPDGKTFAMTRSGQIVLMPAEGGWPVTLTSTAGAKSGLSWSPDGRTIAYRKSGQHLDGRGRRRRAEAADPRHPGPGDPRQATDRAAAMVAQGPVDSI